MIADAGSINGSSGRPQSPPPARPSPSKSYLTVTLLAIASIALPMYFWHGTWFGRRLSDAQMRAYLADKEHPRHAQHALVQLTRELDDGEAKAREYFPQVIELARHERPEVRATAAWVMGWDNTHAPFHAALRELIADDAAFVQRNAALALAKFADPASRPVLRSMLSPYTMKSPASGTIHKLLARGSAVHPNLTVAEIASEGAKPKQIPSPVSGRVAQVMVGDGAAVKEGDALYELAPAEEDMWEALRGLVLVGTADDLDLIRAATNSAQATQRISEQAAKTVAAIEAKSASHAASTTGG